MMLTIKMGNPTQAQDLAGPSKTKPAVSEIFLNFIYLNIIIYLICFPQAAPSVQSCCCCCCCCCSWWWWRWWWRWRWWCLITIDGWWMMDDDPRNLIRVSELWPGLTRRAWEPLVEVMIPMIFSRFRSLHFGKASGGGLCPQRLLVNHELC